MKALLYRLTGLSGFLFSIGWTAQLPAQTPQFTRVQRVTNNEIALTLSGANGRAYRFDVATNLNEWKPLIAFPTNLPVTLAHTDSAARFFDGRFYRAAQITETNFVYGDYLATSAGDAWLRPLFHATVVIQWNGKVIYSDPDDDAAYVGRYAGLPKADLILVTHSHGDHFSTGQIDAIRRTNTVILAPQLVYNGMTLPQQALTTVMPNGAVTNVLGMTVQAVPAYNGNHPVGQGNAYVLTLGDKRIFFSGDTGNTSEMRALTNIDVAFLCINLPFTMNVNDATNAVRAFRPKVVYPYHFRDSSGAITNAGTFKQRLGTDLDIEVRLRNLY